MSLLVGSGIVVASGLFLLYYEAQRETAPRVLKALDGAAARNA
jgi:hypothetical protein